MMVTMWGRPVRAADTWVTVAPGIEHLHRTTGDPQDYHVVLVDLSRPEIWLRATAPGENGQRTSEFALSVGATVAINGDLWDADNWSAYEPLGLAVGNGWKWRDDTDVWSFFACDPTKQCWFDPWGSFVESNPRWYNAVGGMQDLLVIDGVPQSYSSAFHNERHPRTAIGLTEDGETLILLVVDGRRPGALGMNFAELTAVMMEFNAHNAMNNDGGGSSTLFASGSVQNVPSDGSERVVANHLAVMVSDHTDPECVGVENSRQCIDNTQMRTCTGGLNQGVGDCAAYGLTCEQDGLFAYCVDPRCVNGGQQSFCLDETQIAICEDGVYREGDCAGFGLPCVEGFGTAWCYADFHQGTPVESSLGSPLGGALTVTLGEQPTLWFELENTGLTTWTAGTTKLAPLPRDAESPLLGPDWLSAQRIATVEADVAPGERGRFTFTLAAPAAGQYVLSMGLVEEGVTWFADPPAGGGPKDGQLEIQLTVEDPAQVDGGSSGDGGSHDGGRNDGETTVDASDNTANSHKSASDGGCGCRATPASPSGLPIVVLAFLCLLALLAKKVSGTSN
jgi:hypothetical protein